MNGRRASRTLRSWALWMGIGLWAGGIVVAAEPGAIDAVRVEGNSRVEEVAIRVHVRSQPGQLLDPATLERDVRSIYEMGFFEDVHAEIEDENGQRILIYRVKERPLLREVKIEGNKKVTIEDLETALKVRPRTILDLEKVHKGIEEAQKLYDQKGYKDARITFETSEPDEKGEVALTYKVDEGKVVRIQNIFLEGNHKFTDRQLKRILQTKEKWFLSVLTGAGNLDPEVLKTDAERLTAFYYDNGYVNVRIDEPQVERTDEGLEVRFRIDEGDQYKVGAVELAGDVIEGTVDRIRERLETKSGEVFRASNLRKDILSLTEAYGDLGYAFVNVEPLTAVDPDARKVDISFKVDKGPEVYFDRIQISGNTKTKDQVVRRELAVQEQQRFSGTLLKASRERVQRLGFFQEVNMTTQRSADPDKINLLIDLKEGQTGAFTAGAGFSSADSFLFNVRLSENNLFGSGDRVAVNGDLGSIRQNFTLDYVDTYFLDSYFTMSFSGFNFRLEFDDFTRKGSGFSVQALYPITALGYRSLLGYSLDEVRFGLEYKLELADIGNLNGFFQIPSILSEAGERLTSSVIPTLVRNTLNHPFDPTDGSVQNLSVQFAGVGGDADFLIVEARSRWFYPFYKSPTFGTFVASTGGRVGWGIGQEGRSGREIPLFERFFPGGINSVRGFRTRTLGPREPVFFRNPGTNELTATADTTPVGGSSQLIFNNELIFPIIETLGLRGVLFFDIGNAFQQEQGLDLGELRYAAGWGFRWLSPIGPLRIEIGYPLDKKKNERSSVFLFSFGAPL